MGSLDGRVALITGGARGQGRSHALAMAAEGADIVALDVPGPMVGLDYPLASADDLFHTARLVEGLGRRCLPLEVDIRDGDRVDAAVKEAVAAMGRVDIAVANAGIVSTGPLVGVSDSMWHQLVDTNLTGTFHTLRAILPVMKQQQFGRVVAISSMGGRMGLRHLAAYNATKWGVIGLAKSAALEFARDGITINVVCPTTTKSPMAQFDETDELPDELVASMTKAHPIPQPWLQPEDVSRAVLYLVSDPGVISGSVLEISLGSSARLH